MAETIAGDHKHVFLGEGHEKNERRTWMVIALCSFMMVAEIVGGLMFGSIALVADGLHMSTHASALLLAALAYSYARRHANDTRFTFGTGKLGDLAGFSSAIILAMIALLIGYEAAMRFVWPVPIDFNEAIPIAVLGLVVNVASVFLLSGGGHDHSHSPGHSHGHSHSGHDHAHEASHDETSTVEFAEHEHADSSANRDNNMQAAIITFSRTRQCRCRSSSAFCLGACWVGHGWIQWWVWLERSLSLFGLTAS